MRRVLLLALCKETVLCSDQVTHCTSLRFIQLTENRKLRRFMSHIGNCWDEAWISWTAAGDGIAIFSVPGDKARLPR